MNTISPPAPSLGLGTVQSDVRPTADAAAVARNPQPTIPLPVPASMGPLGAINQARLAGAAPAIAATAEPDRLLKPYGITMLPYAPGERPMASNGELRVTAPVPEKSE